jgi:rhodanese-related sulfurtransferase
MIRFLLYSLLSLTACAQQAPSSRSVTAEKLRELQNQNANLIILDVRTPEEIMGGKIQGAVVLDYMKADFERQVLEFDKSKTIVAYCATGYRSGEAVNYMRAQGFSNAFNLSGGVVTWQRKGYPLVR